MPNKKENPTKKSKLQELLGLLITFTGIFFVFLIYTDAPPQLVGKIGILIKEVLIKYTGVNRYFLAVLLFFFGLKLLIGKATKETFLKYLLFCLLIFLLLHLFIFPF